LAVITPPAQECGIVAKNLSKRGVVWQKFVNDPAMKYDMLEFHVFHADEFDGIPVGSFLCHTLPHPTPSCVLPRLCLATKVESEEMKPQWYDVGDIPYSKV